jgi:hypothetical protein
MIALAPSRGRTWLACHTVRTGRSLAVFLAEVRECRLRFLDGSCFEPVGVVHPVADGGFVRVRTFTVFVSIISPVLIPVLDLS